MTRDYQRLIAELRSHVETLAAEAWQGDREARQWLLEAFPGNQKMMRRFWPMSENIKLNHDKDRIL